MPVGVDDRGHPVAGAELLQHVRDVSLDRGLADVEPPRDFGIAEGLSDEFQNLALALGQLRGQRIRRGRRRSLEQSR